MDALLQSAGADDSHEIGRVLALPDDPVAVGQVTAYLAEGRRALGVIPTQDTLVLERFFDESGGMQLVLHAPFGSRINKAWALALRKRFCREFNFELQAAATEDGVRTAVGHADRGPAGDGDADRHRCGRAYRRAHRSPSPCRDGPAGRAATLARSRVDA